MSSLDLVGAAAAARAASDAARAEILPRFRNVDVETKQDGSPVTEADRAAERAMRAVLREFDTGIGILGEEYGEEGAADGRRWIIDPIDGTIAFSRGIPLYGTLIALIEEGTPLVGLIDLPSLGERYVGHRGGGVRRFTAGGPAAGSRVQVSEATDLRRSLLSHGDAFCFDQFGERPAFDRMCAELPIFRGYSDAFGHSQVLNGGVDAMIDVGLNPWDAAATQCLVPEAGGRCETIDRTAQGGALGLVFGSPALVEQLLEYLGRTSPDQ